MKKRKYMSLSQSIIIQYIFVFGILLRPLPNLENLKFIDGGFWQIIYVLVPKITYYFLVVYSAIKVFKLKSYLLQEIIA